MQESRTKIFTTYYNLLIVSVTTVGSTTIGISINQ